MRRFTLTLLALMMGMMAVAQQGLPKDRSSLDAPPTGYVNGLFTVNEFGTQVYFSQGNLQYADGEWRFAEYQWAILGDNGQGSADEDAARDLFGWATSGQGHGATCYQPWSTSQTAQDYYAYGDVGYNLFDESGQADWGSNGIANGGGIAGLWRVPTVEEWNYVFFTRTTASGIRYAKAKVNGVRGVILLPDDWQASYHVLNNANNGEGKYRENMFTLSEWDSDFEAHGAVFLPAAGYRFGTKLYQCGNRGSYYSATSCGTFHVYDIYFDDTHLYMGSTTTRRNNGLSVRLVATNASLWFTSVTTGEVTDITSTGATASGTVTTEGGTLITAVGVCWSTSPNPTVEDAHTDEGALTGDFTSPLTGLERNTTYYLRAYATDGEGDTMYGDEVTFTTLPEMPAVTTAEVTEIDITTATAGGEVTDDGGTEVDECGVCWSTEAEPTLDNEHITATTPGMGAFTVTLTGLTQATTYYVCAYVTNSVGTAYGEVVTFTTLPQPYSINVSVNPTAGGTISKDGEAFTGGTLYQGDQCTLTATPSTGYDFVNWTENGTPVSTEPTYSFEVAGDRTLVANFQLKTYTINVSVDPAEGGTIKVDGQPFTGGNINHGTQLTMVAEPAEGYVFVNWTEGVDNSGAPIVVSTEASYTVNVITTHTLVAHFELAGPEGALKGVFTVRADGYQVLFSKGNLQYIGSVTTPYWKFADHQWECFRTTTGQNSEAQNVDRDLFGWGTSGYDHGAVCYQPWSTSETSSDYYAYGNKSYHLFDQTGQADWGCNAISNGGNTENSGWRTLTQEEWDYLFNTRNPNGIRYAKAEVNGVNGVILLPDDWNTDYYELSDPNNGTVNYNVNIISLDDWGTLEHFGAVFLPAAGLRNGTLFTEVDQGLYWSASRGCYLRFSTVRVVVQSLGSLANGRSVRLIRPVEEHSFTINASANPEAGGTVSGEGSYTEGASCTLTATPNEGYTFINWTEGVDDTGTPKVVSTEQTYTFRVMDNHNLVANFASGGAINGQFSINADGAKVFFSKGNLQYIGSAATPYWKFADHQWDYLGNNGQGSDAENVDRDLFGWGTSGYAHGANCYQPWSTSTTYSEYYAYNNYQFNLFDQTGKADWGYNPISNGGGIENSGWRTLTHEEWAYLFNTRGGEDQIRYAKANVNSINGVILLPDDWSSNYYTLSNINQSGASFASNTITASQWNTLEQHGAVFLPAAGRRNGTSVNYVGSFGYYWSASCNDSSGAWLVCFGGGNLDSDYGDYRYYGRSVRLVRSSQ